jgi:hypothetical protein
VIYISTAHGIKIETRKYKKVIKTKNHEESAEGRQIQANKQKEKNFQQAACSSSTFQQNASSISKPASVRKSMKDRVTYKL